MSWINEVRHDISTIQSSPHDLKKFGMTVGGFLLLLCGAAFWKGWWNNYALFIGGSFGIFLLLFGLFFPTILRVIHGWWMSLAIILGSVVSRVILFIVFFSIVILISLSARVFGKKFYSQHKDHYRSSYWIKRDQNKTINYERMS